jgi:hypothetical protein
MRKVLATKEIAKLLQAWHFVTTEIFLRLIAVLSAEHAARVTCLMADVYFCRVNIPENQRLRASLLRKAFSSNGAAPSDVEQALLDTLVRHAAPEGVVENVMPALRQERAQFALVFLAAALKHATAHTDAVGSAVMPLLFTVYLDARSAFKSLQPIAQHVFQAAIEHCTPRLAQEWMPAYLNIQLKAYPKTATLATITPPILSMMSKLPPAAQLYTVDRLAGRVTELDPKSNDAIALARTLASGLGLCELSVVPRLFKLLDSLFIGGKVGTAGHDGWTGLPQKSRIVICRFIVDLTKRISDAVRKPMVVHWYLSLRKTLGLPSSIVDRPRSRL